MTELIKEWNSQHPDLLLTCITHTYYKDGHDITNYTLVVTGEDGIIWKSTSTDFLTIFRKLLDSSDFS